MSRILYEPAPEPVHSYLHGVGLYYCARRNGYVSAHYEGWRLRFEYTGQPRVMIADWGFYLRHDRFYFYETRYHFDLLIGVRKRLVHEGYDLENAVRLSRLKALIA